MRVTRSTSKKILPVTLSTAPSSIVSNAVLAPLKASRASVPGRSKKSKPTESSDSVHGKQSNQESKVNKKMFFFEKGGFPE